MNDHGKPSERSTFPLPLSSVTGGGARKPATPAPVATPQTATANAARAAAAGRDEWRPVSGPLAVQAGQSGEIMRIGPWAVAAAGLVAAMAALILRQ